MVDEACCSGLEMRHVLNFARRFEHEASRLQALAYEQPPVRPRLASIRGAVRASGRVAGTARQDGGGQYSQTKQTLEGLLM